MTNSSHDAAVCQDIQAFLNIDVSGVGVLGSFALEAFLVLLHVAVDFPIFRQQQTQLRQCITASSLTLFDTASLLAMSWQVASINQLTSTVQTSHTALAISMTASSSVILALGALYTTRTHMRRHWYRLTFLFIAITLYMVVTVLAGIRIEVGQFPVENCLPFFKAYLPETRRWFVVESVVFWICAILLLSLVFMKSTPVKGRADYIGRLRELVISSTAYIIWIVLALYTAMFVMVTHLFVPEQKLRAEAGGILAESHWSFGQIIAMWIWFPVISDFGFVLVFGETKGLQGRLPEPLDIQGTSDSRERSR